MTEPIVESMEVAPSADSGNVPAEAPKEEPTEPVAPTVVPEKPTESELYELPDGRKVDAGTLSREWKENFYPDYTRKSQELAKTKTPEVPLQDNKPTNPLADPTWVPKSYAELVDIAKNEMRADMENDKKVQEEARTALENEVSSQIDVLKKADPSLNENALFLHATKYQFRDLRAAHQNMKDMSELAKNVQQTTVKNIAKRADPVSATPGATGARSNPNHFSSATEYLRSIK